MIDPSGRRVLAEYAVDIADTDVLNPAEINPILQGLFGEVGGIMSTAKKHIREKSAYPGFKRAAEEEFGDTLWYLAALCRRLSIPFPELIAEAEGGYRFGTDGVASEILKPATPSVAMPPVTDPVDTALFNLGRSAAALLGAAPDRKQVMAFARDYLYALQAAELTIADVARRNVRKARGAFITPSPADLFDFDAEFGVEEQLPRVFKIRINQRVSGKSYLQWNGVFIGDPLTDNIADPDGYRFHDVFHLAYAAILHWSPVVRALIKHKRKSRPAYDEAQDSGRAIVVEEGLTAWIFARAKELNFFEGQDRVSLGILKTIGEFVSGYEVSQCPLKLWERAILEGYEVFRQIRAAEGGWIIGDRSLRTIRFAPLEPIQ
jgi:hypothetical protein